MTEKKAVDEAIASELTLDTEINMLQDKVALQRDELRSQASTMPDDNFSEKWHEYGIQWRKLQIALDAYYELTGNGWIPF